MNTTPARQHARPLLGVPLVTDNEVLARVAVLVEPRQRRRPTLWLFFIRSNGTQANLVVPINDIPEVPEQKVVGNLCQAIVQVIADSIPGASAVIALARPGTGEPCKPDQDWLRALQWGVATYRVPVRMLCLATEDGIRELGPVDFP